MHTNNVVSISHVRPGLPTSPAEQSQELHQAFMSRDAYRRRYERRTVALALARAEIRGLRMKVEALERNARQCGAPDVLLRAAGRLLVDALENQQEFEAPGRTSVRHPVNTIEFTHVGEALIGSAQSVQPEAVVP